MTAPGVVSLGARVARDPEASYLDAGFAAPVPEPVPRRVLVADRGPQPTKSQGACRAEPGPAHQSMDRMRQRGFHVRSWA